MALINCAECGREISDKSNICIHCGYPLNQKVVEPSVDVSGQIYNMQVLISNFTNNPSYYAKNFDNVIPEIVRIIYEIRSLTIDIATEKIIEIEDNIAREFLKVSMNNLQYCSWKTNICLYQHLDFSKLSDELKMLMAKVFSLKASQSNTVPLWYPIHQLIKNSNNDILSELMNGLNYVNPDLGFSQYDSYDSMVSLHLDENGNLKSVYMPDVDTNHPKCPTCGSLDVERISTGSKLIGGAMFGLFSSDVRNTMCCNSCKHKW